jgi:hypothetical protein
MTNSPSHISLATRKSRFKTEGSMMERIYGDREEPNLLKFFEKTLNFQPASRGYYYFHNPQNTLSIPIFEHYLRHFGTIPPNYDATISSLFRLKVLQRRRN